MHRGVITCRAELLVVTVARMMAAHRIHSVVVPGAPLAVVTDADLPAALSAEGADRRTAGEIAREAAVVAPIDSVAGVLELMVERETTHAIVVDAGQPVGVVSVLDIAGML